MKRYGNLYHKIYAMDNLELAYHDARKGKTWQKQIQRVDAHKEENLERLQKMLMNHAFHTAEYRTKEIYEPKHRTIYILPFYPDRIVQHAIINVMAPIWDSFFIYDSYACRKGKGQHKGSIRCMQFVRQYEYCI